MRKSFVECYYLFSCFCNTIDENSLTGSLPEMAGLTKIETIWFSKCQEEDAISTVYGPLCRSSDTNSLPAFTLTQTKRLQPFVWSAARAEQSF